MKSDINIQPIFKILKKASKFFKNNKSESYLKNNYEYVSNIDFNIEVYLKKQLKKLYPNYGFIGEETAADDSDFQYFWVVDPIDGTNNFIKGVSAYLIQIALLNGEDILFSAMFEPITGDFYYAIKNVGAFLNFKKIKVNDDELNKGIVTLPDCKSNKPMQLKLYEKLFNKCFLLQIHSSAAYDFALLAKGASVCHIINKHKIWDYAPGYLMAKEAGAHIEEIINLYDSKSNYYVCANSKTTLNNVVSYLYYNKN